MSLIFQSWSVIVSVYWLTFQSWSDRISVYWLLLFQSWSDNISVYWLLLSSLDQTTFQSIVHSHLLVLISQHFSLLTLTFQSWPVYVTFQSNEPTLNFQSWSVNISGHSSDAHFPVVTSQYFSLLTLTTKFRFSRDQSAFPSSLFHT